jgi:hypothetical protein
VGGLDLGHHTFDLLGHFIELAAQVGELVVGVDLDAVGKIAEADLFQAVLISCTGWVSFLLIRKMMMMKTVSSTVEMMMMYRRTPPGPPYRSLEWPKMMRPHTVFMAATLTGRAIR